MRIARFRRLGLLATLLALPLAPGRAAADDPAHGAKAGAPPAEPAKPPQEPGPLPLPPGSPADQALWKKAGEVSLDITTVRTAANGLQWRIHTNDLVGRLTSAAKAASPEEARGLDALRERLVAVQTENYVILTTQWPVDPTRGCQYPQLMLGSAMHVAEGAEKRALLAQAREDAQKCVETAERALGILSRSSDALSKAVDASIGAVPWPASPPAGAVPAPASPAPAAAGPVASPDGPASARKE